MRRAHSWRSTVRFCLRWATSSRKRTAVGSAIGDSAEASESDDADAARELERATLEAEAVPGWSRDDDD